jgi:hypothetical protein
VKIAEGILDGVAMKKPHKWVTLVAYPASGGDRPGRQHVDRVTLWPPDLIVQTPMRLTPCTQRFMDGAWAGQGLTWGFALVSPSPFPGVVGFHLCDG